MPHASSSQRLFAPGLVACLLHLGCDALLGRIAWARPPYLRLEDMPEPFRELPFVSAPLAVSVAASVVGGILAAIALAAVEPAVPRRGRLVTRLVTGFWIFSAFLSWATWLSTPFLTALPGMALGIPRGLLVGWAALRAAGRPAADVSAGRA